MKFGWLAAALLLFGAASAAAQSTTTAQNSAGRKMLGIHVQDEWKAVGRLNFGRGFCSAALIAPDLVATAAHCLFVKRTGAQVGAERIHFVAGYRMRKFAGHEKAANVAIHPDYVFSTSPRRSDVASDLALVRLKAPMAEIRPFLMSRSLEAGDEVAIVSYGRDRPEIASIQSPCGVLSRSGSIAVLDCDATYGVSGAPVLRFEGGEWQVAGVVSAMAQRDGRKVVLAVVLPEEVGAVLGAR
ncbi:MAG: trypsin-like serine peptidase [Pikeienuella sp.]